jgi:O-antigen/teichoic acid export membrane protein
MNVAQVQERAGLYVLLTGANLLATVLFTVVFVVFLHRGAPGYLMGALVANALLTGPFLWIALREIDLRFDVHKLRLLLAFSLPLILHGVASWALSLSDRAILQRYVSLSEVGLYSIGYQIGSIMVMIAMAIANAWNPFLFRRIAEEGDAAKPSLARLVTYYTMTVGLIAVVLSMFGRELLVALTSKTFHAAYPIVPIVVVAYFWNALYVIPAAFLFLVKRTSYLPIATIVAGVTNIALNLWLVPVYGIIAAAWATFFAFLVLFLIVAAVAARVYQFPYEYHRLAAIVGYGGFLIMVSKLGEALPVPGLLWKLIVFASVPALLTLTPFLTTNERAALSSAGQSIRRRFSSAPANS